MAINLMNASAVRRCMDSLNEIRHLEEALNMMMFSNLLKDRPDIADDLVLVQSKLRAAYLEISKDLGEKGAKNEDNG